MKEAVHLAIGKLADDSPIKKHLTDMEAQVVFNCLTEFNAELHDKSMRDDGRQEGRAEGEQRLGALMSKLLSLGKTEEAMKASSDPEYRNQLYKQYNL